jgi:hypothetical protein
MFGANVPVAMFGADVRWQCSVPMFGANVRCQWFGADVPVPIVRCQWFGANVSVPMSGANVPVPTFPRRSPAREQGDLCTLVHQGIQLIA